MAKKKSPIAIYKLFFEKFKRKDGYISSLLKNGAGENVFEFNFVSTSDTSDAKEFLSKFDVRKRASKINKKSVMVILD